LKREEITELHYIAPIANVPSIMQHGILSHNRCSRLQHSSVAMKEIQEKREKKKIPGTNKVLHDFANLYFDAHNPMLSKVRGHNNEICILRVHPSVLDLSGVIVTDRNASSDYVRFYSATEGLKMLNTDKLFAKYWTHPDDSFEEWEHKSKKCAEVLVPDCVPPKHLIGAYVANQIALESFQNLNTGLPVEIRSDIFF
jgi:hypothetical protein